MLKISKVEQADRTLTLQLEGRVVGPWVAELRRVCEAILAGGRRLRLDLAEVSFVDKDGVMLFLNLRARGAALQECSAFIEEELKTGGLVPGLTN